MTVPELNKKQKKMKCLGCEEEFVTDKCHRFCKNCNRRNNRNNRHIHLEPHYDGGVLKAFVNATLGDG